MIKKQTVITGLDIGSSKVSAVASEIDKGGVFTILAQVTQNSKGVSRGAIVDLDEAVSSASGVLSKLRDKIGRNPGDIYANISGQTITGARSTGMIPLSIRGREVTKADMDRCANAAGITHVPFDREIIHRVIQRYSIDDRPWVRNPLGLYASRLNCEVFIVTADSNHAQNIYKCVNNAGYDVKELVFTGIADGAALFDKEDKGSTALLLDMGASLTEICIFCEGAMSDLEIAQVGADEVKAGFKDNARFDALLSKIEMKRDLLLKSGGNISSVILTGAAAFIDDLIEFMEERLSCRVKIGVAREIKGDISSIDSMKLTTAIGLAKYAHEKRDRKRRESRNIAHRISNTVVDIFNNYF